MPKGIVRLIGSERGIQTTSIIAETDPNSAFFAITSLILTIIQYKVLTLNREK